MNGIGIILLGQLLSLEFQLAQYFGGIAQQVILALIVMLPVIRLRRGSSMRPSPKLAMVQPSVYMSPTP